MRRTGLLRFTLDANTAAPWWLGLAYYDWIRRDAICYPIPLNLVVRLLRAAHLWLVAPRWLLPDLRLRRWMGEIGPMIYRDGYEQVWRDAVAAKQTEDEGQSGRPALVRKRSA